MSTPQWRIRPGRPDDRQSLASFTYAYPDVPWQAEVEQFVQRHLVKGLVEAYHGR
jgi:hypothetical protein